MERIARNAPVLLLVAAQVAVLAVTLSWATELTFYADTWALLMNRRDPSLDAFLQPHNEHLIAIPVLFEQVILRLFGMSSAMPEYVLLGLFLVATSAVLYVYVKRRVGPWLALFAAVLVLTLGPAWEVLLWPFEITFVGPVLCGLAALLALEREDRLGDAAACLLLTLGLGFSSLGLPFLLGGAVAIAVGPRQAWLRRAYVVAVPAALFVVWYFGWGADAGSNISASNVLSSPRFVADEVAAAAGAVFQFRGNPFNHVEGLLWDRIVAVFLCLAIAYRLWRGPRPHPGLWPVLAIAGSSWFLTAFNDVAGRSPTASRYLYAGAIFVLLILANVFSGARPSRPLLALAAVLTALVVAINVTELEAGHRILKRQAELTRADLGAVEIARDSVEPALQMNPETAGTPTLINVFAGPYLSAAEEYGSPAYSPAEIAAAGPPARRWADHTLAAALPISVATGPRAASAPSAARRCVALAPGADSELPLRPGLTRIVLAPGPDASLELRRFGEGANPVRPGDLPGGAVSVLRIPADTVERPWRLRLDAAQSARVCPAGSR